MDLALGADEPLLHGRLRDEEGARDLGRAETAEGTQGERDARLGRQRRMAAGEDQPKPVVGNGAVLDLVLLVAVRRHQRLELPHLVLEPMCPPDAVDRLVAGSRRDPGAGVARHTTLGPDLERDEERILHRFLGEVEVADDADERRDRPPRFLPEQAVDGLFRRAYRPAPASWV